MSTFKGTPGPWHKTPWLDRGWLILHDNVPHCQVKQVSSEKEDEANAFAIAAVPELIEALQEILRFDSALRIGAESLQYPNNFLKAISAGKAALSKSLI